MKDILKLARELNDNDLKKLINKLQSTMEKRKLKALEKEQEERRQSELKDQLRNEIDRLVSDTGLTLESLGYVDPSLPKPADKKRGSHVLLPENQTYYLDNQGVPQLLFSRKIKQYREQGLALSFSELTSPQQDLAREVVHKHNNQS